MDNNLLLNLSNQDLRVNKSEYQHGIGSWIYLRILIRLDIAYILRKLSYFMVDPTIIYLRALKKLLKYMRSSIQLSITFSRDRNKTLKGYSNSDFTIDKLDRISILRNIFILVGGLVSQISRKQKLVSTSTIEAEYIAMSVYIKRLQFIIQILRDIGYYSIIGSTIQKLIIKES